MFGSQSASGSPAVGQDGPPAASAADYLLAAQTPQQQELSRRIYERLKAGDDVDDIRDLVDRLGSEAAQSIRQRRAAGRPGGAAR